MYDSLLTNLCFVEFCDVECLINSIGRFHTGFLLISVVEELMQQLFKNKNLPYCGHREFDCKPQNRCRNRRTRVVSSQELNI